jgi:hypothetical protein
MDGSASRPRHCLYLEQAREVVRGNERTYRQAERLADGVLHTLHPVQDPHHAKQKSTRFVLPSRLICYFTRLHTDSALVPVEVAGFVL